MRFALGLLAVLLFAATPAQAQQSCPGADPAARRVALVIGIEDYTHVRKLNNPVRDATAIADLLCRHGIQPTLLKNPTHAELLIAADAFESDATGADLALVYYAGHGMNLMGEDVILPKDLPQRCEPKTPAEAQRGTLRVDRLVASMRGAKNRVALFDACRTTTFPSCPGRGDGDATFRGLSRIAEQGALIATSTSRGSVAADGIAGRHSPYAELLLKHLAARPRAYVHDVLFDVNRDLLAMPGGQRPELLLPSGGVPPRACLAGKECGTNLDRTELARLREENAKLKQSVVNPSPTAPTAAVPPSQSYRFERTAGHVLGRAYAIMRLHSVDLCEAQCGREPRCKGIEHSPNRCVLYLTEPRAIAGKNADDAATVGAVKRPIAASPASTGKVDDKRATGSAGSGFVAAILSTPKGKLEAMKAFADIQQKYPSVLAGKPAEVQELNLGETKGVWYRVVVGPPGSRASASQVCEQLKAEGFGQCFTTAY